MINCKYLILAQMMHQSFANILVYNMHTNNNYFMTTSENGHYSHRQQVINQV